MTSQDRVGNGQHSLRGLGPHRGGSGLHGIGMAFVPWADAGRVGVTRRVGGEKRHREPDAGRPLETDVESKGTVEAGGNRRVAGPW